MKTIQQIMILLFFGSFLSTHAQQTARKGWDGVVKGGPRLNVSYNSTMPNSATKDVYVNNSSGISGDVFIPLQLFRKGWDGTVKGHSFGLNIGGTYNFGGNGDPSVALPNAYQIFGQNSSSVAYKGVDPKNPGFRIGGGPQANFNFGEHFTISSLVLAEYFSMTQKEVSAVQTTQVNGQTKEYNLWTLPETKTTGLAITPKVRLRYMFTNSLGIFADAAYIFGPKINTQISILKPLGNPNQAGQYEQQQLDLGTTVKSDVKSTSYNALSLNVGFSFDFGRNRCPNGDCRDRKKVDDKGWNGISKMTKADSGIKNTEMSNGSDIFTATHIKKESSKKPNCVQILSPSNGSNQSINEPIKVVINNENLAKTGNVDIKIYKISNDKNYFNKIENLSHFTDTQNSTLISTKFDKEAQNTGFNPITLVGKQSGAVIESSVEKGKLTEGVYRMVVVSECGVTSSNFTVTPCDVHLNITNITDVCEGYVNGGFKHKICFTSNYQSSNCDLKFTSALSDLKIYDSSISPIAFTQVSGFPLQAQLQGAATSKNYCIEIITTSPSILIALQGDQCPGSVTTQCIPGVEATLDLKSCICDFCEKALEYDSDYTPNASYTAAGNSLSIHQAWWDMNPATAATIVAAKAEIISFSREVSDDCMKCDKNSNQWGNFISGTSGLSNGSFGNATNPLTGNTHHTLYFANPNKYFFDLNISLPPISTLTCCCEKFKIKIRYTYTYKDQNGACRMCSEVFEYSYQKGQCPIKNPTGGGIDIKDVSTKVSNIKN
ncbi:hypothetical protein [Kaistella jeonii]|uniref:Uncharacterized protein n=1 Tax=Kaistella jeonii TaxID=266749 RepID=A0A0C1FCB5_9FLAO|nr:hypothetical protein [Kaistella jeonii]KIA90677.1 hypothetical protein OA86_02015 [Kaistella jeonii]SFB69242.1 hypothetical protein SAMN05421876_101117 [Kaistella jeonii]VEI94718.1 Uncharacterised protein [Kaistella jeonii]